LAPLEAALSGCALLLNDIPSFRELWGDTACYFEHNNADSLAREIRRLARDRELREQFAARAYAVAITAFSPDRMVDSYERVYHTLVKQEAYA
jgi:glycogen synthase